jgi:hypothetical protein
MNTISKNARLSITALMFGAALITGVNAFGMEQEQQAQREYKETERAVSMLETCANTALESNKLSTFSSCMSKAAGHQAVQPISKKDVIGFSMASLMQLPGIVDTCLNAGHNEEACVDRAMSFYKAVHKLSMRTQEDADFSNN